MAALACSGEMGPIEGYTPASRIVFPRSSDACCGPRPEWWTHPPPDGRQRAMAIPSASSASSAVMRGDVDQPTIIPNLTPITTARWSRPRRVRT